MCTVSCAGPDEDKKPTSGGTDFIVLQIWNQNTNPIHIKSVTINGVAHIFDVQTREKIFDPTITTNPSNGEFPRAGMYSIILPSSVPLTQQKFQQVDGDREVLLVIKLNTQFLSDLDLSEPLLISVNIGDTKPTQYTILTGDTK